MHDHRRLFLAAWLGVILAMTACGPAEDNVGQNDPAVNMPVEVPRKLPMPDPPMNRSSLLVAAIRAASDFALGRDVTQTERALDGRSFEMRIRFGCPGSADTDGSPFSARYEASDRTLRLSAAPDLMLEDGSFAIPEGGAIEAVEGFWIRQPWLLAAGCPPAVAPEPPATAEDEPAKQPSRSASKRAAGGSDEKAQQTDPAPIVPSRQVGLAQFFSPTDSRTGRRHQRAYQATKRLAADQQPSQQGYDLVMSGRLKRLANGRVITCQTEGNAAPPTCIISVDFDQVRIEQPGAAGSIAEWRT